MQNYDKRMLASQYSFIFYIKAIIINCIKFITMLKFNNENWYINSIFIFKILYN